MRVSELKVGQLYKIRSDVPTYVSLEEVPSYFSRPKKELLVRTSAFVGGEHSQVHKNFYFLYLGQLNGGRLWERYILRQNERMMVDRLSWRHIEPMEQT